MAKRPEMECPHCGGMFRAGRNSCPHCGADHETGWLPAEDQEAASLDLQETSLSDSEYESFLRKSDMQPRARPRSHTRRLLAEHSPLAALLLLALLLALALWRAFS
ncbi:MAG: hypothetical protein EXS14_06925 [Planctomycetes bacterium]|nr:hypothetical protein [Planctomycetota bacterium]